MIIKLKDATNRPKICLNVPVLAANVSDTGITASPVQYILSLDGKSIYIPLVNSIAVILIFLIFTFIKIRQPFGHIAIMKKVNFDFFCNYCCNLSIGLSLLLGWNFIAKTIE